MPIRADDLRAGQYVAIARSRETVYGPFGSMEVDGRMVTGIPLKVLAVSLPFLAVTDGTRRYSLDIREVELTRLTSRYVKQLTGVWKGVRSMKQRRTPAVAGSRKCPSCGDRLIERLVEEGTWIFSCRRCGFTGGPPKLGKGK